MSKGPTILKVSGIVMILQGIVGSFVVLFYGLSLFSMLSRRNDELRAQLKSLDGILNFAVFGLMLITAVILFVCAMRNFNTYNYYTTSGGNNKYLTPNRMTLILGALTFLASFGMYLTSDTNKGSAVLMMISSAGWVLALLNLIIVKKDRAERAMEDAMPVRRF